MTSLRKLTKASVRIAVPRPEAIIYGMMQLQRKIKIEKFFGGANHKMTNEQREESLAKGGLHGLSNENYSFVEKQHEKAPIIVTDVPADFDPKEGLKEDVTTD